MTPERRTSRPPRAAPARTSHGREALTDEHVAHALRLVQTAQFGNTDDALQKRFGGYRERFAPYLG